MQPRGTGLTVPVRETRPGPARPAVPRGPRGGLRARARVRGRRSGDLLLRAPRGRARHVAPRRRRRRGGEPELQPRCVLGCLPVLPRGSGRADVQQLDAGHGTLAVLRPARGDLRGRRAGMVPHGRPPARRAVLRCAENPADGRPAGAAAGAGLAVRRAHPRAQQPGRGGGAGHVGAARAGRGHAAQTGRDRLGPVPAGHAGDTRRDPGADGRAGGQGSCPDPSGDLRPRGRPHGLAGRPRDHHAAGSWRRTSSRPASMSTGSTRSPRPSARRPSKAQCGG